MGGKERLDWIDYARGVCIILVVTMHFHGVFFNHIGVPDATKVLSDAVSSAARPARMPTFFFISGFLASRALDRPWSHVFDSRIGLLYWTYLLWSIVATLTLFALYEPATVENAQRFGAKIALQAVYPRQSTWFLYGLVVFFVAARMLRRWPLRFIVTALVASSFSEHVPDVTTSEMLRTLPFFLLGVYFPASFLRLAGQPSWRRSGFLAALYAVTIVPILYARDIPGIWLPATAVGMALILSLSRLLADAPGAVIVKYIGRNTLPIYVMHISLLLVARETSREWLSTGYMGAGLLWTIGIAVLIALCLALFWSFKRTGMGWLFAQPKRLTIGRAREAAAQSQPLEAHAAVPGYGD